MHVLALLQLIGDFTTAQHQHQQRDQNQIKAYFFQAEKFGNSNTKINEKLRH
jgi:hypothetical protein